MRSKAALLGMVLALAAPFLGGMDAGAQAQTRRAEPPAAGFAVATFAGGCFWCMEPAFDKAEGVVSTTSGYTGGTTVGPSYKQVSRYTGITACGASEVSGSPPCCFSGRLPTSRRSTT